MLSGRHAARVILAIAALAGLLLAGYSQRSWKDTSAMTEAQTRIVFLGDSLTDGYHLDRRQAYPALLLRRMEEKGWRAKVVNAGISGDTTGDALRRLEPLLRLEVDMLVLALGINDVYQGVPLRVIEANLQSMIDRTRASSPEVMVVVAGIELGGDMFPDLADDFRRMYERVAERNGAALAPSLLDGVSGVPGLTLPDGVHPTEEGQQVIAETMWGVLEPVLEKMKR
jgi:acyl-CoA thioesterase-1